MKNFLKLYQQSKGLVADGICGPKTSAIMMQEFGIKDKVKFCHFMGQIKHESNNFTAERENMNYDVKGLLLTFPKYFSADEAARFAFLGEKIANRVYANRMGNGSAASGDGWKYRGWLSCQLTGKNTIEAYCRWAGVTFDQALLDPVAHYFKSAVWYFNLNSVWDWCKGTDTLSIIAVSKKINLGEATSIKRPNGLDERINATKEMFRLLGVGL